MGAIVVYLDPHSERFGARSHDDRLVRIAVGERIADRVGCGFEGNLETSPRPSFVRSYPG
jgi:hypothetical protein